MSLFSICLLFYLLVALGLLFARVGYGYSCFRHIYNYSNTVWTFQDTQNSSGNLYFLGDSCPVNGPCHIQPHQVVGIQYTQSSGYTYGKIKITDHVGTHKLFQLRSAFKVCPYIQHNGDTGAVGVNDPAKGDYSIVASKWG